MRQLVFGAVLALAFAFFGRTIYAMVRAVSRGTPDPRPRLDQLPRRLASVLIYFFGQKKVAEEGPMHMTSKHHLLIFWGFLIITIGTRRAADQRHSSRRSRWRSSCRIRSTWPCTRSSTSST